MYVPGLEEALARWWSNWVRRGRIGSAPFSPDGVGWVLTYTRRYRLTTFVLFLAISAFDGLAFYDGRIFGTGEWRERIVVALCLLVWFACASVFVASRIERVTVTPQHLRRRSWRGRQEVAWPDVDLMKVDHDNKDVKIGVTRGTLIDVSFYLDGLHALADALDRHFGVPAAVLEAVIPPRGAHTERRV